MQTAASVNAQAPAGRQSTPARGDRAGDRLVRIVAASRHVEPAALFRPSRGKADIALCRQLAMYLMHVVLSRSLAETGTFFRRDRTTVAHACAVIEDLREDPRVDAELDALETLIAVRT